MNGWNELQQMLGTHLGPHLPGFIGALALLAAAALFSRMARGAVRKLAQSRELDARLRTPGIGELLANVAYWTVWLLVLPALLGVLGLEGLLQPVNATMERLFGVVPNLLGALVVLGIGLLTARILRELVTGILTAAGSERLAERIGLKQALGERTLAGVAGYGVFVLVLLPTLTAALQTLGLEVLAKPIGQLLDAVIALIPRLVAAALIVAIGVVLGRILAGLLTAMLAGLGLNRLPGQIGLGESFRVAGRDLSELAGGFAMVAAVLLALTQACEVLGFAALTSAVAVLGGALANLLVASVILGVGLWLATLAAAAVAQSKVANARMLGHVVRGVVLFFAGALALRQAGLPADIIAIAFASVFGAVALAVAIAVGVGGRHVAARLLDDAATSFKQPRNESDAERR
jgi:hypothetical protein